MTRMAGRFARADRDTAPIRPTTERARPSSGVGAALATVPAAMPRD